MGSLPTSFTYFTNLRRNFVILSTEYQISSSLPPMNNFIIVIGREYGAGGRRLGKELANRLDIPYYDKELISEAAESIGISKKLLMKADEKRPSLLRSFLSFNYGATSAPVPGNSLSEETLYELQSRVIRAICEKGPCVIVGRTADYVMREHPGLLSVFVHAPEKIRAKVVKERGEADTLQHAIEIAKKSDRERESYYNYFTNRKWGAASNYDLTFDSSKFSLDEIISVIRSRLARK